MAPYSMPLYYCYLIRLLHVNEDFQVHCSLFHLNSVINQNDFNSLPHSCWAYSASIILTSTSPTHSSTIEMFYLQNFNFNFNALVFLLSCFVLFDHNLILVQMFLPLFPTKLPLLNQMFSPFTLFIFSIYQPVFGSTLLSMAHNVTAILAILFISFVPFSSPTCSPNLIPGSI